MKNIVKNLILILLTTVSTSVKADFLPKGFSAQFDQEYISILKGTTKKGNGTIDYQYPSNIRFKTTLPSEILYVSNGIKTWYYRAPFMDGEEGEVTETSAKEGSSAFTKFFDSLKHGLVTNKTYTVSKKDSDCKLVFSQKFQKEHTIKEAQLHFLNSTQEFSGILSIELIFSDNKKSTIKLHDIKINPLFDGKFFQFVAPPKTKTVS